MKTATAGNYRGPSQRNRDASGQNPISCVRAAEILRRADAELFPADREQIAAGIQEARRRMNNEHLH
jgi:hypothetical protein